MKKAVQLGYVITNIDEIWQYSTQKYNYISEYCIAKFHPLGGQSDQTNGFFVEFINIFLKIKQQASGWPSECTNEETRNKYIREYSLKENINLDETKIEKNPDLRSLAKLCLNSFWG